MRGAEHVQVTGRQQLRAVSGKAAFDLLSPVSVSKRNLNTNMITLIIIKRIVVLLFVTAFLATIGVGCNTAHGFGKDMEKAGENIQDGTK